MKPISFEQANKTLLPSSDQEYLETAISVVDTATLAKVAIPVFTDEERCISCWRMSFLERLRALFFGKVWVATLTKEAQPPMCLTAKKTYFR